MFAPRGRAQGITRGLTNKSASFHTRVKINTTCYSTSAPFRFVSCTATDESTGICNTVRVLALPQLRQQDNLPIRKFQSVMISVPFGLTCWNFATLCPGLQEKITPSHRISLSKESSVPGSKHTATLRSSAAAKPRVGVS